MKKCFKCGKEKPLSEFYKHSKMSDGHVNKCIECNKIDVKNNYKKNIQNFEYVEKERERGRIKYSKYKYKRNENLSYLNIGTSTRRFFKSRGYNFGENEIHHWSYKKEYKNDIFVLERKLHSMVHLNIFYNTKKGYFQLKSQDVILDTKKKMYDYINLIKKENNLNCEFSSLDYVLKNGIYQTKSQKSIKRK